MLFDESVKVIHINGPKFCTYVHIKTSYVTWLTVYWIICSGVWVQSNYYATSIDTNVTRDTFLYLWLVPGGASLHINCLISDSRNKYTFNNSTCSRSWFSYRPVHSVYMFWVYHGQVTIIRMLIVSDLISTLQGVNLSSGLKSLKHMLCFFIFVHCAVCCFSQ